MEFSIDRFYRLNRQLVLWLVFFGLIYLLRDFFLLVFLTFILGFFAHPAVRLLNQRFSMSPTGAVVVLYTAILGTYAALVAWIAPKLVAEVATLRKNLPDIERRLLELRATLSDGHPKLRPLFDGYLTEQRLNEAIDTWAEKANQWLPQVAGQALGFGLTFLLAILFSFLILVDIPGLTRQLRSIRNSRLRAFYEQTASPVIRFAYVVGQTFNAQAVIACANTALTVLGLLILGVPSILMLSLIVFFCSFIPALGVFLSTVPMVLITLNAYGVGRSVVLVVFICVIHAIEAYILNPLIYGRHLKLNPILILMILYIGHHGFGLWGMLLGVPVAYYLLYDVLGVPAVPDSSAAGRVRRILVQ